MSDFDASQLRARLKLAAGLAERGAVKGLRQGGEHLLGESLKIIPIEEGTLGRTGKVSTDSDGTTVAVSFEGPYAVIQHEDLTFKHDPGRHAKYLETPMNTEAGTIREIVADAVRKEMGR